MAEDIDDRRSALGGMAVFLAIAVLILFDVLADYREGASWGHISIELIVLAVASTGIVILWRRLLRTEKKLSDALVEAEEWKRESRDLIQGLGVAIKHQFERWNLSNAECEIGLFLLKGLSHREIAGLRQTSERTIREQARSLYRKSGLSGRNELSAFFLEDLLVSEQETKELV